LRTALEEPSAPGFGTAIARVQPGSTDPNAGNNDARLQAEVVEKHDLAVTVERPQTLRRGEIADYTIMVHNNGPNDAIAAMLDMDTGLAEAEWRCDDNDAGDCEQAAGRECLHGCGSARFSLAVHPRVWHGARTGRLCRYLGEHRRGCGFRRPVPRQKP
jgi:hypothetical protein